MLEVPGPEGGYPLALSYHGGIEPNEDASWVGLGWTLNPGAINRSVNGFPDDWYGAGASRRDFWEGGTQTGSRIGVTVPLAGNIFNLSFGLSFSNDTYEGRGVGGDIGLGFKIGGEGSPVKGNIGVGISAGSGDPYVFGGIGGSSGGNGLGIGAGLNVMTNFKGGTSIGASVDLSYASMSALGMSISSTGSPSFSVGGFSASTENSRAGTISTETKSFSINLLVASYSRQKTRYWSNETELSNMYGALYPSLYYYTDIPDQEAYDSYALQEENKSIVDNPDPNKLQGGAYPSYDVYQVTAQGLGGAMRPYRFEGETHQQNRWERPDATHTVKSVAYISNSYATNSPAFRFEGDFSNNYIQNYPDFPYLGSELIFYSPPNSGRIIDDPDSQYGMNGAELAGSKHISYFVTKTDGTVSTDGRALKFITPVVSGLNRVAHTYQAKTATHIAGFSITNASGVTYHYNLPAHSYEEEMYQELVDRSSGLKFNRQTRIEGYAYTWYLTAITGADYVDRGTIGVLDNQDFGYWVGFEYGKWSDNYVWRNPSEGYHRDDDNNFKMTSLGRREVYYLNAIRTRSHVALFEKDVRNDAKSASPEIFNKNWVGSPVNASTDYQNEGVFNTNSSQSMRLDRIYLLNSSDVGTLLPSTGGAGTFVPTGRTIACSTCELHANVLDKNDVNAFGRSVLESNSLRIIDFNYDYALAKGTTNSYDINTPGVKTGKLTLNSVRFRGKGGVSLLPAVDFEYGLDATDIKRFAASINSENITTSYAALEVGDLLETDEENPLFCGVITAKNPGTGTISYTIKNRNSSISLGNRLLRTTKNPPYNSRQYDSWGMYKADYTENLLNENLSRLTTPASNKSADAWSLRKVKTSLGAELKIEYEGDTYSRSVLNKNHSLFINNFTSLGSNNFSFSTSADGQALTDIFKVGDKIDFLLLKERNGNSYSTISTSSYTTLPTITSISGNYIYINCPEDLSYQILNGAGGGTGTIKTGNLKFGGDGLYYGGGLRVKSIAIDNIDGVVNKTKYTYTDMTGVNSSGVTSYEPISMEMDNVLSTISATDANVRAEAAKTYRRELYKGMSSILALSREVPAPAVMYEYVTISNEVYNSVDLQTRAVPGKNVLQFEVFRENMVGRQDITPRRSAVRDVGENYYTRNLVLKKFVNNIGALKRITVFDNNGYKIGETINHFLHDGLENLSHIDFMNAYEQRLIQYNKQGLVKERYSEVKSVWTGTSDYYFDIKATLSAREDFPAIQTGQTSIDYLTGTRSSSLNVAFDFYSGAVTKMVNIDSYGNRFMKEMIPAYKKYPEMGLMTSNILNKNMLKQETANYLYQVDESNNMMNSLSASIQLWGVATPVMDMNGSSIVQNDATTNGKVWRKTDAYNWMPEGQLVDGMPGGNIFDFAWDGVPPASSSFWKKVSATTLYDVFSKPLQMTDLNGHTAAMRMGYNNTKVVVAGNFAEYNEIAYSGAEDPLMNGKWSANVSPGTGTLNGAMTHSGSRSLLLSGQGTGFNFTLPASLVRDKDYYASVWASSSSADFNNVRLTYTKGTVSNFVTIVPSKAGNRGWYLLELKIPRSVGSGDIVVSCVNMGSSTIFFDDFRFRPLDAVVNSYVYDSTTGELTYAFDNNNLFTQYQYDGAGRLVRVAKEVLGKSAPRLIQQTVYNYWKAN